MEHFKTLEELYNYVNTLTDLYDNLPIDLKYLFDTTLKSKDIKEYNENEIQILLHFKIDCKELIKKYKNDEKMSNIIHKLIKNIDNIVNSSDYNKKSKKIVNISKETNRTDTKLISENDIKINSETVDIMKRLIKSEELANEHNDIVFNNPKCYPANKTLKLNDFYGLDKLGIVIKRKMFNNKSKAFSWKYIEGTTIPISYYYNPILTDEDNIYAILSRQYQIMPQAFEAPKGVIYKIYSNDEELFERYKKFMEMKHNKQLLNA